MWVKMTDDGSLTLLEPRVGETYHSLRGARTEAQHVFLEGSGVLLRFERRAVTTVVEVGFGTGLNFLVTAAAARRQGAPLRYVGLERALPAAEVLAALDYGPVVGDPDLARTLTRWRRSLPDQPAPGIVRFRDATVELELRLGPAQGAFPLPGCDAIYHDAFSPTAEPELWTRPFLAALYGSLEPGGALVSYSVQGALRRRLADIGFEVHKRPGPPGGKRECLLARRPRAQAAATQT